MNQRRQDNNQQVALVPPRMLMPVEASDLYGLNEVTWRALTDAVFPLAKTVGAVMLALAYCERNRLDVFQKVVHIVPMRVGNKTVETVWPGIGQIRVTALRQPTFAGYDDCEFGDDVTHTFKGRKSTWDNGQRTGYKDIEVTLTYPEWAQFIVYKMLHGQRIRMPGPKVWFNETFASKSDAGEAVPNDRWERAPRQMLEKCAEAACYRRAFPDVLGNEMSAEEMEGRTLNPEGAIDAEYVVVGEGGEQKKPGGAAKPKREDFAKRNPLDGDTIPSLPEEWEHYIGLLKRRLAHLTSRGEVDAEEERQRFRIEVADMKTRQRLHELFAEVASALPAETAVSAEEAAEQEQQQAEPEPEQQGTEQQQDAGEPASDLFQEGGDDEQEGN